MTPKQSVDVERLLHWAYRDELSKRVTSSAEAVWLRLEEYRSLGAYDFASSSPQRYDLGEPHPDALAIERAVAGLPDLELDWSDCGDVLGSISNLLEPGPAKQEPRRNSTAAWRNRAGRQVNVELQPPRQVLLVRSLRTNALVTMHANAGTRPDWVNEQPRPHQQPAERGPGPKIIGECKGRLRYTEGSYCPLRWEPSPIHIAQARCDYMAWWAGLEILSTTLQLEKFYPLRPSAPRAPWLAANALAF